jgi:hypothetical protein
MMVGSGNTTTLISVTYKPPVNFRAVPSMTVNSISNFELQLVGGSVPTPTGFSLVTSISSPQYLYVDFTVPSGGIAGYVAFLRSANSSALLVISAEL